MTPEPTGRVIRTESGRDLVLTRRFEASIEDVWASVTEPVRTARWFGSWTGKGEAGQNPASHTTSRTGLTSEASGRVGSTTSTTSSRRRPPTAPRLQ